MIVIVHWEGSPRPVERALGAQRLTVGDHFSIGRVEDNDIVLHRDFVARHHCEVWRGGKLVFVRDTKSTGGTMVNATTVHTAPRALCREDRIVFGEVLIEVADAPGREEYASLLDDPALPMDQFLAAGEIAPPALLKHPRFAPFLSTAERIREIPARLLGALSACGAELPPALRDELSRRFQWPDSSTPR